MRSDFGVSPTIGGSKLVDIRFIIKLEPNGILTLVRISDFHSVP